MADSMKSSNCGDSEAICVAEWLREEQRIEKIGTAIRNAVDWVIDGARTQRFDLTQVEQGEKLYLGNRVEHEVIFQLDLTKNLQGIDTTICGFPVDIKFSIGTSWMIPPEGFGHLCLILSANDAESVFSVGVFRADARFLNAPNRDGKRSINKKIGYPEILWAAQNAPLPENFLLHLDSEIRERILSQRSGQARVTQAFRLVLERPISIVALDTLAVQRDPSKRARDARKALSQEGIKVLCGRWKADQEELRRLGLPPLEKDQWISTCRR